MKNILIRVMAILFLATSFANLATASEPGHNHTKASANQQSGCASSTEEGRKENKQKTGERSEQEREFERVLMGIYG